MHWIDWAIIGIYLVWIVCDGLRLTRRSHEIRQTAFALGVITVIHLERIECCAER